MEFFYCFEFSQTAEIIQINAIAKVQARQAGQNTLTTNSFAIIYQLKHNHQIANIKSGKKGFFMTFKYHKIAINIITGYTIIAIIGNGIL